MTLEQQVVSPELAKKLKELGVEQESAFYWHNGHFTMAIGGGVWNIESDIYNPSIHTTHEDCDMYSAFTVAELGEMLPYWYLSGRNDDGRYFCQDTGSVKAEGKRVEIEDTEADARALMVIYLKEKGLI